MVIEGENSKARLLGLLKSCNGSTAQDLAQDLSVSVPAVRRHLVDLSQAGWVTVHVEKRCGRGRPQQVYRLSQKGEGLFPKRYAHLCLDILAHLESLFGSDALLKTMDAREDKLFQEWLPRFENCTTLEAKLYVLVEVLCEAGYQARLVFEGSQAYLEQGNCPNLEVACTYKQLCVAEQRLYERLLETSVVRESQISSGAGFCRYRVKTQLLLQ
ncbi:MAG: HTH domain-containing protein [Deinococcaceae bacterium]